MKDKDNSLSQESKNILYTFTDEYGYACFDYTNGFNSIKFNNMDLYAIDKLSYIDLFKLTLDCVKAKPGTAFKSFAEVTDLVWGIRFNEYGIMNFLLILISAVLIKMRKISFVHSFPLLCYNFGTMLLLSGNDARFFYINIPLWLPTIFITLKD